MSNKIKSSTLDLDMSDVIGPTKQMAEKPAPAETSSPTSTNTTSAPAQNSPLGTTSHGTVVIGTSEPPKEPTSAVLKASIPVRLPDGSTVMKALDDCSGKEFLYWADSILPLPGKADLAQFQSPEQRERAFNNITGAIGRGFLFGGQEYKKKKYSS